MICISKRIFIPLHYHNKNITFLLFNHHHYPGSYSTDSDTVEITNLDDTPQLFDEMLRRKPQPSIHKFNQLIMSIVKNKQYSTALSLYKRINSMGIRTNI